MTAERLEVDEYFLSATNPLATADQRDIERRAMALIDSPAYARARASSKRRPKRM